MDNPGHHLQRIDLCGSILWLHYFERTLFSFDLDKREFQMETPPFASAADDFFLLPDGRILVAMERGDIWVKTLGNWEFLTEIPFAGLDHRYYPDTTTPREQAGIRLGPHKRKDLPYDYTGRRNHNFVTV